MPHRIVVTKPMIGLEVGQYVSPVYSHGNPGVPCYFDESGARHQMIKGHYEEFKPTMQDLMTQAIVAVGEGDYFEEVAEKLFPEYGFVYLNWDKYPEWSKRFKVDYFEHHLCTDTYVGHGVITIDGRNVAIVQQTGRKCDAHIFFLDAEAKAFAKEFAKQFLTEDDSMTDDDLLPADLGFMWFK